MNQEKKQTNLLKNKNLIGAIVAIVVMAVISLVYFYPDAINGNVLQQHDSTQGIANGQEAKAFTEATGEVTRWTNSLFSGMPTFQISPSYESTKLVSWIGKVYGLGLPAPANLIFMMMIGFFILMLAFKARWYVALFGAIAYAFSTYFFIIIGAGHIWKFATLTYVPPTIAGIVWCYRKKYALGGIVAALAATMQLASNHFQMTYYFAFLIVAMAIGYLVKAIKEKHPEIIIQYHGHTGPGLSMASILEVCENGADIIDVAIEPMSWGKVHPDVISVQAMLKDAGFQVPEINMNAYMKARSLTQEFIDDFLGYFMDPTNKHMSSLLLGCGLPGGMMGSMMADLKGVHSGINLILKGQGKEPMLLDDLVVMLFEEVEYVWPKLGYPPLVTPFSQYVKNVALMNVMQRAKGEERWTMIDNNTWDMILGKSGKLPGELAPEIIELAKSKGLQFTEEDPQSNYPDALDTYRKEMDERAKAAIEKMGVSIDQHMMINSMPGLLWVGIGLFALTTLFSFVTLPVEINASARAVSWLSQAGITDSQTRPMAIDALKWAAYTYVIAAIGSLATLLYYIGLARK